MSNNIDIKTLEAFQDGNHKAFETVFIAYYNKTKAFIDGYIKVGIGCRRIDRRPFCQPLDQS